MGRVRVDRIVLVLLVTFGLSWGFDLAVALAGGQQAYLDLGMSPLGMFLPAFVVLSFQLFVFKDSPIHAGSLRGRPLWILYSYLILTVAYGIVTCAGLLVRGRAVIFQGIGSLLTTLWTLLLFYLYGQTDRESLRGAGLQLGDVGKGSRLVLGVVAFFAVQAGLNLLLGLGELRGHLDQIYGVPIPLTLYGPALVVLFIAVAVIGTPLSGLAAVFGEEYAWRGFLQTELAPLGRRRAALLVGLVWGLWHVPVVLSGIHTYPPTALGLALAIVFFVLWGVVQSYAVIKTNSIWVAAFLHGVVNSVYAFTLQYIVRPDDMLRSFGLGLGGLACLAIVVLTILRDPIWRAHD